MSQIIDKSVDLDKRIRHVIHGDMCAIAYLERNKKIPNILKSKEIKWWADKATKSVLEEIESTV